jgi:hypothetical protein
VLEELDEAVFWMEMLIDTELVNRSKVANLMKEGNELTAIFAAARSTMRKKR